MDIVITYMRSSYLGRIARRVHAERAYMNAQVGVKLQPSGRDEAVWRTIN